MTTPPRPPLRVAIIGAGPAGIYAGNILHRELSALGRPASIDLIDSLPAPYGLIRYGVAPDHPRIKGIVNSLHEMLDAGTMRFFGNVTFGTDVFLDDLRTHYHAVIFATGAIRDAELNIPGVGLPGSFGAADFVSWFDGHPDAPRNWPLDASSVAVLGNGNVALDVARMLAKHADDLLVTDIPANVYEALASSRVTDVHVFGRRGPADVKFTPIELRELAEVPDVDVVLHEEDFVLDDEAIARVAANNQLKVMTRTLQSWVGRPSTGASRHLHLHFFHAPVEISGEHRVEGMRFKRTRLAAGGSVVATGEFIDYQVQAVYRAVGYFGSPLPGLPFDSVRGVIPNEAGRILAASGDAQAGLYATGWIKRGPVGLIGHTKSDAAETITKLIEDLDALCESLVSDQTAFVDLLDARGVEYTTWVGWLKLDAHERSLGDADGSPVDRERIKVVDRDEMVVRSRGEVLA